MCLLTRIRIDVTNVRLDILRGIYLLEQQGKVPNGQSIAEQVTCAHITFKRHIPVLVKGGLVRKIGGSGPLPDRYFLTDFGLETLKARMLQIPP